MGERVENSAPEDNLQSDPELDIVLLPGQLSTQSLVTLRITEDVFVNQDPDSCLVLFSTDAYAFCAPCPVLTKLGLGSKNRILDLSL